MSDYFEKIRAFPDFMTGQDLIKIGLYKNVPALYRDRCHGNAPDCVKIGNRTLYPRESVISFILSRLKGGDNE